VEPGRTTIRTVTATHNGLKALVAIAILVPRLERSRTERFGLGQVGHVEYEAVVDVVVLQSVEGFVHARRG
jgi:hypothetical protein